MFLTLTTYHETRSLDYSTLRYRCSTDTRCAPDSSDPLMSNAVRVSPCLYHEYTLSDDISVPLLYVLSQHRSCYDSIRHLPHFRLVVSTCLDTTERMSISLWDHASRCPSDIECDAFMLAVLDGCDIGSVQKLK
ncbi:hypothetical protein Tco_0640065 [Tanacetum coccineum]